MHSTTSHLTDLLAFGMPGGWEWVIILLVALLIFGRRLPEVGRSVGKSIVEFKRGVKGINDEIETESSKSEAPQPRELTDDTVAKSEAPPTAAEEMPARHDESS
ncbi:MAG: twin-arginine translocase TatA/TatE family subunit [Phycisphaerales bacterium]|jgi:sec-independent protein translocase protein TatA|nr:twin-arginine translocase TatA/TatE family subunit [Phycisphaerales bacterium]